VAKRGAKAQGRGRGRKLSRFNLSRKGEIVLAGVGVVILAALAWFSWTALSPKVLGESPEEIARRETDSARLAAKWEEVRASHLVVNADGERQDLHVAVGVWDSLLPTVRESYVEAAAAHHGWSRCFVLDSATGRTLGWYQSGRGFHATRRDGPPGTP
jgi:hypothetical protein